MKLVCLSCGRPNRLPAERLGAGPRCGACGAELLPEVPAALTPRVLERAIRMDGLPLVVDFWAEWCGPCRMMAPELAKVSRELRGRVRFAKLDTEAHPEAGGLYGIRSIPLLILFSGGREAKRQPGARPAAAISSWVTEAAGA